MGRCILHLNVPLFPIQLEMIRFHHLRGKPVVLAPNFGTRAVVQATSEEAKLLGIRNGMLLSEAEKHCRDVTVIPFDERYYRSTSPLVSEAARKLSPLVEPRLYSSAWADVSYAAHNPDFLTALCRQAIKELQNTLGVSATCGLAANKLVSMIAAQTAARNQVCQVVRSTEKAFLQALPPSYLPAVDTTIQHKLVLLGWQRIAHLACCERAELIALFGATGDRLHDEANGIDFSPVRPPQQGEKVFSTVLAPDSNDLQVLRKQVVALAESAATALRAAQMRALLLSLEVDHADERTVRTWLRLERPAASDAAIKAAAGKLLVKTIKRRVGVRALTLRLHEVVPAVEQMNLFTQPLAEKQQRLTKTLDLIKASFGDEIIGYVKAA